LGLHLSQRLASLIGGRVVCDSQPGTGSTFTLLVAAD
jgi:signal transduction histidine kinase